MRVGDAFAWIETNRSAGACVRDRDALAQRQRLVRGPRELYGDALRAEPVRDEVRHRERQLLLVEALDDALRARVGAAVPRIEDHERGLRIGRGRRGKHSDDEEIAQHPSRLTSSSERSQFSALLDATGPDSYAFCECVGSFRG